MAPGYAPGGGAGCAGAAAAATQHIKAVPPNTRGLSDCFMVDTPMVAPRGPRSALRNRRANPERTICQQNQTPVCQIRPALRRARPVAGHRAAIAPEKRVQPQLGGL